MIKKFNVLGTCVPEEDYMVDISGKLEKIKALIDNRYYFTINRARQYGKTTTLSQLRRLLSDEYVVISTSFQGLGDTNFATEEQFCQGLLKNIRNVLRFSDVSKEYYERWYNKAVTSFDLLSEHITNMCEGKQVVLMIDEVDQASNHRVFLNFLGMLREKFLARKGGLDFTFHSVILAGVYDIKNIKLKLIGEGVHTPPWNIVADFEVRMSFSPEEIAGMLSRYETDYKIGMDIPVIAEAIYSYTNGYPFLVSRICQYIDEKLDKNWSERGVLETVKLITEQPLSNPLFDDLFETIDNNQMLSNFLYRILMQGDTFKFSPGDEVIALGLRHALIRVMDGKVHIHNKIFEMMITDYFIQNEKEILEVRV